MQRLKIFAKGNVDLHDSLHSCRLGKDLLWNGINEALRTRHPHVVSRLRHETWTRSDALLESTGTVPEAVASRGLPLGAYPAASQFRRAVFAEPYDAVVLSIQPDVMSGMMRHRRDEFLLYPSEIATWSIDNKLWVKDNFVSTGHIGVERSMDNLHSIIKEIRILRETPILVYNMSSIVPGETVHCYEGLDEALSTRIRRFNVGLVELSGRTGISIIDVDRLVARHGADRMKRDLIHLTAEGYGYLAHEVVRVFEDIGIIESASDMTCA